MTLFQRLFQKGRQAHEDHSEPPPVSDRLARLRDRIEPEGHPPLPVAPFASAESAALGDEGAPHDRSRFGDPDAPASYPASPPPRPVALARKPRVRDRDWSHEHSWFGGLPRLGEAAWPVSADGVPLPFAAQIDLAELAAACPESPLPRDGALAFFLNSGAVIHVAPGDHPPTPAPADLPLAFDEGGHPLPDRPTRASRPLFPVWPVEPIGLALPEALREIGDGERHEEIYQAQADLLGAQVPGRQYTFSVGSAREAGVAGADRLWWYGAQHVLAQLQESVDAVDAAVALRETWIAQATEYQARLAAAPERKDDEIARSRAGAERHAAQIPEIRRQGAELEKFVSHVAAFVGGRSAWSGMTDDECAMLEEIIREARRSFPDLCRYRVPMAIDDIRNLCVRRMITGGAEEFAALPDDMLTFINERYRLAIDSPHQMFGLAGVKQSALYDHLDDLLLLQIGYDDLVEWRFGDMGLWQFWISPTDAAAGRWEKAQLTFECA